MRASMRAMCVRACRAVESSLVSYAVNQRAHQAIW